MTRPTYLQLDCQALQHNLARVRELAPGRLVLAMVKANAYGHGIAPLAKALQQADALGVACLDEAIKIRQAGMLQRIVLLEGLFNADEIAEAEQQEVDLVVHHLPQVEALEKAHISKPFFVWIKINTGMNRLGIQPENLPAVYQRLSALASVKKPLGLMTHFAEADMINSTTTKQQINLFKNITAVYEGPRSLANSAGILAWPDAHGDWVRPGLMLYGAAPFSEKTGQDYHLKPVMTLASQLIAVSYVKKDSKVGYGGEWSAPEDMQIGVVAAGYGDGYPQFAKSGTPVLVNGKECPLVGRVSMDLLTVDLRSQPQAKVGDPVVLWGKGLPVERVAKNNNTSAYALLTCMTSRPWMIAD